MLKFVYLTGNVSSPIVIECKIILLTFCADIEVLIEKAAPVYNDIFILGDLNARNTEFCKDDITNMEGRILFTTCNRIGLKEIIHEPTLVVGSSASCIDLIFTNNPDMVCKSGVGCKIAEVCDHCPIYAVLRYRQAKSKPKSYKRMVWNFKVGN